MAQYDPQTVHIAKSGLTVQIRHAKPADAKALTRYTADILAKSPYLISTPQDYHGNNDQTKRWIKRKRASENELVLLAEHDSTLIAVLDTATDPRKRLQHLTRFGLTVAPDWQGKGVGHALLTAFIDWAKTHPVLTRIRLHVHAKNVHARTLYHRAGFLVEGEFKDAILYEDGRYMDEIVMSLALSTRSGKNEGEGG